jgi:hypothetical protein
MRRLAFAAALLCSAAALPVHAAETEFGGVSLSPAARHFGGPGFAIPPSDPATRPHLTGPIDYSKGPITKVTTVVGNQTIVGDDNNAAQTFNNVGNLKPGVTVTKGVLGGPGPFLDISTVVLNQTIVGANNLAKQRVGNVGNR